MAGEGGGEDRRRRQLKSRAGAEEEGNPLHPSQHLHSGQRHRHRRQRQSLPPPLPGGAAAAARTLLPLLLAVIFIGELIKLPPSFYYGAGRSVGAENFRRWLRIVNGKDGRKFSSRFSAVFCFPLCSTVQTVVPVQPGSCMRTSGQTQLFFFLLGNTFISLTPFLLSLQPEHLFIIPLFPPPPLSFFLEGCAWNSRFARKFFGSAKKGGQV